MQTAQNHGLASARTLILVTLALGLGACGDSSSTPFGPPERRTKVIVSDPPPAEQGSAPPISASDPNSADTAPADNATLTNLAKLIQATQASPWHSANARCQNQTIAIFDNGFEGLKDSLGKRLPPNLVVQKAPANEPMPTAHGTKLAEVIWAMCTGSNAYSAATPGPTLLLFNTNGYTNLQAAVEAVTTTQPVDIVLYSQVWEFGGNFDGGGFINALVNRVTNSTRRTLWVNASGNFAETSWQGGIVFDQNGNVKLPFENKYLRISVNAANTAVKLTLAWNDFTDAKTYRTKQDLNLFVEDASNRVIASSTLIQDGIDHGQQAGYSAYAREQLNTVLGPGIYFVKISSPLTQNFNINSRLRLSGDGEGLVFMDQTKEASVMIPADNSNVLTIGASDVDFSSSGKIIGTGVRKPEAVAPSIIEFDNGKTFAGSSSAAAVAASLIGIYQSKCGALTKAQWTNAIAQGLFSASGKGSTNVTPVFTLPNTQRCVSIRP